MLKSDTTAVRGRRALQAMMDREKEAVLKVRASQGDDTREPD